MKKLLLILLCLPLIGFGQINGCTDPLACNYNPAAIIDDGSCVYPSTSTSTITACDSYFWNSTTYNTSGSHTYLTTNANGCDSTAILNLSINNSTSSTTNLTTCAAYSWIGTTYTTSGIYTYLTTNANGCDSIVTLNLTINSSTTSVTTQIACNSFNWYGTTYTSSGTYIWVGYNATGCDTSILNLTISNSTSSTTNVTSFAYTWNGIIYTTSGIYTYLTTNANGCDSTATLNLTITTTGISDIANNKSTLVKITDMLGQETPYRKNTPLFYIYDDGTVEKRIVIE